MKKIETLLTAPLKSAKRKRLQADAQNIKGAAARKQITLDGWDEYKETYHANHHFELGCWLYYYHQRIGQIDGLPDRIDCMRRIFAAGFKHIHYEFYTIFDFGERQFDTLVEMGDSKAVIAGVRKYIDDSPAGKNIRAAFEYMGWPIEPDHHPQPKTESNTDFALVG